jgi:hypothetical protein
VPFFDEGQPEGRAPLGTAPPDPWSYPSAPDVLGAAFRQNNPVVSVLDAITRSRGDMTPVPGYDPVTRLSGTKDDDLIEQSLADVNPAQTDARIAKKNAEITDRQTLAASGWGGTIASVAAGALDPSWFVPIIGEAKAGEALGLAYKIGKGLGEGAVKSAISESTLQQSQVTRTVGESANNIATNSILMGLVGGGLGLLSREERAAAIKGLDQTRNDLSSPPIDTKEPATVGTQPELPLVDKTEIVPDGNIDRHVLASDLSAAEADQRTMKLAPILLPDNMMQTLREVPVLGPTLDYTSKVLMGFSPTLRIFSSASLVAKRAMGDLAETSLRFTQADSGITTARGGIPVDRLVKMQVHDGQLTASEILRDNFIKYRGLEDAKLPTAQATLQDIRGQTPGKLSFDDFKSEVSAALVNGDEHGIPQVQDAAKSIRAKVLDPVKRLAQRTNGPDGKPMLEQELEPPKGDKSFFPRIWNKQAIAANYNNVKRTFADWLESEQGIKRAIKERLQTYNDDLQKAETPEDMRIAREKIENEIAAWEGKTSAEAKTALRARTEAEMARAEKQAAGEYKGKGERLTSADTAVDLAVKRILASDRELSRQELESRAAEIINRINVAPDGRLPYDAPSGGPRPFFPAEQQVRGSLNAREFAIPTSLVKDYVNTDTEHVMASYLRTVIPDIHLTDRFGDIEMTEVFKKLNEEYDAKLSEARTQKQQTALDLERRAMIRDLAATRDRIRNVYGWELSKNQPNAARIANVARNWNVITDLGTSVFNRLNDVTNAVWRHGLMNVFSDGYIPFLKSMIGMGEGFATTARQSMKDMGVGVDSALGHLSHQWGDVIDNNMPGSKFERALAWSADKAMLVNLHGPWTDGIKTIAGTVASADFLRTAERVAGETATKDDFARLAIAGIDRNMACRIWEAYSDNGGKQFGKGTHIANVTDWTDRQAAEVFSAAISRSADQAVLTPGLEKPLWMSSPVVSLLGQYKSFIAAAHEKVLISNLQQADARTLQGLIAALGMGMISYRAYTLWSGAETSSRPQDWIKEAISRSAMLSWFTEVNSMQAKFTGGATDMFRAIGADHPLSRRASNSALSEMLGPTYSRLEGMAGGVNDAFHGTWTAMDTHKFRQAIWLQNLFAVRRLLDAAEDGFNEHLGIKPLNRNPAAWPSVPAIQMQ